MCHSWPLFCLNLWQHHTSVILTLSGLCDSLTDGGIVCCLSTPAIVSFLSPNLLAMQQFELFMSYLIAWNGCKWNRHKPACLSIIVYGCERELQIHRVRIAVCKCFWMLWMGMHHVYAMDVDNVCAQCVFSFWLLAICVYLGLKAPVSEGVSGGHLNRICSRITWEAEA